MSKKFSLLAVAILMALSFTAGAMFAPEEARTGSFGTCGGGCWTIHQPGFCGVKLDGHLKLEKVDTVSDHTINITVVRR